MNQQEQTEKAELGDRFKEELHKQQVKEFMRSYESKQKAVGELATIYANNVLSPHFDQTFKAAVALITLPSLVNIYYALRPNSILAGVMPFAVPILCLANYIHSINSDLQTFCFSRQPEAGKAREQFRIIYKYSYFEKSREEFMSRLENFTIDQKVDRQEALV